MTRNDLEKMEWAAAENGPFYAFECATAIVIIYYLALIDTIGEDKFNASFDRIILYDWHYEKLPIYTETGHQFQDHGQNIYLPPVKSHFRLSIAPFADQIQDS